MSANRRGNPNPTNSAVIQAVLDAITAAQESKDDTATAALQTALQALQRNKRVMHRADMIYNSHRYPDKSIKYTKTATYDQCPTRFCLSHNAQVVYDFLASIMTQQGLVRISQSYIADILRLKRTSVRQAITELCQYHFVAVYSKPPRGSKTPPTYMIDRRIMRSGQDVSDNDINDFVSLVGETPGRNALPATTYQQAIITQKCSDGKIIRIGTVVPIDKAKEPASAPTKADTSPRIPKPRVNDTMVLDKLSTNIIPPPDIDDIMIPDINNIDGM